MPIEAATYISQLDVANPSGSDPVSELDNHIRLIKQIIKTTFPNVSGVVSASHLELSRSIPIGFIGLWSGAIVDIPTGWVLCAGQTSLTRSDAGGTLNAPDLRDKFVLGAGGAYAVAATGGATSHAHAGTVSGTAITVAQMPNHSHGVSDPGHAHGVNDPGHTHAYNQAHSGAGVAGGVGALAYGGNTEVLAGATGTGISIAGAGTGISIQANGSNQAHDHGLTINAASSLPPYYALAYIMKI